MTNFGVKTSVENIPNLANFLLPKSSLISSGSVPTGQWVDDGGAFVDLSSFSTPLFVSGPLSKSGNFFGSGSFSHTSPGSSSSSAGLVSPVPATSTGSRTELGFRQLSAFSQNKTTSFCFGFVNLSVASNTATPSQSLWFRFDIEKTRVGYSVYTASGNGTFASPIVPSNALPNPVSTLKTGFFPYSESVGQAAAISFYWDGYRTFIAKFKDETYSVVYDGLDFSSGSYYPFFLLFEQSGNHFGIESIVAEPAVDGQPVQSVASRGMSQVSLSATDLTANTMVGNPSQDGVLNSLGLVKTVDLDYCPPDLSVPPGACPFGKVRVGAAYSGSGNNDLFNDPQPTLRIFQASNPTDNVQDFLTSCAATNAFPYILANFDTGTSNASIRSFITQLNAANVPLWLSIQTDFSLTTQKFIRGVLDSLSAEKIAFCGIFNPNTLVSLTWESGIWDIITFLHTGSVTSNYLDDNISQLAWVAERSSRMIILTTVGDESYWSSIYNFATTASGSIFGATPVSLPKVEGIAYLSFDSVSSDLLDELKNSVTDAGQYSRFLANQGVQKKVFYADELLDKYSNFISNYIQNSDSTIFIFGSDKMFSNILSAQANGYDNFNIWGASRYSGATPVDAFNFYLNLYRSIQDAGTLGSKQMLAPGFSISPRGEGFDTLVNGALVDSRYFNYFTSFMSKLLNSGDNDDIIASGVCISGNFLSEDWSKIISYIRTTLSYNGVLMTVIEDRLGHPNITSPMTVPGFRDRNSVSEDLAVSDFCVLPYGFIFLGEYGQNFSDWTFDGTLTVFDEMLDVKLNFDSYTETVLSNGFIEVTGSQATPYYFSAVMPVSGGSLSLGQLVPGTYRFLMNGLVGADGDANMRVSVSSSNFSTLSLSLVEHFTRRG
jgi:hypothetical protein